MSTEALPAVLDTLPPANLADLVLLRTREMVLAPLPCVATDSPVRATWERCQAGMVRLLAQFQAHACGGSGCRKCVEFYIRLQVLEYRKRTVLPQQREGGHGQADHL
jgi:hypothetical protein